MNDDKKPVVPEGEAEVSSDTETHDEAKIEVKSSDNASSKDDRDSLEHGQKNGQSSVDKKVSDEDDEADTPENRDEDEVSAIDRELERVEGIESTEVRSEQPEVDDLEETKDDASDIKPQDGADAAKPVDLDPVTPNVAKEQALMTAMQNQNKNGGNKKGKSGAVIAFISILAIAALGVAGYLYMQNTDLSGQKASAESELNSTKSQNTQLKLQQAKIKEEAQKEAQEAASQSVSEYRNIPELRVRFKENDVTKNLIYGYTVTAADASADSVAFSTITLAKLAQRNGASATYPCGFTGNVPTITRYKQDVAIGTSMASKVGKKIGDAYFVYTAPTGQCATTNTTDMTARDTGAKAIYDGLEAIPVTKFTDPKN